MWLSIGSGSGSGKVVEVTGDKFVVGRAEGSDLVLDDPKISGQHASLEALSDGRAVLRDLGSTNGTFVNGRRIDAPGTSTGGETLSFGDTQAAASLEKGVAQTVFGGAPPAEPPGEQAAEQPRPKLTSAIERIKTQRSARYAFGAAVGALIAVVAVVVLFLTGVLGGSGVTTAEHGRDPRQVRALQANVLVQVRPDILRRRRKGWVYDLERGLVATNAHVVNSGETFKVGEGADVTDAAVIAAAPCDDLAVLKLNSTAVSRR